MKILIVGGSGLIGGHAALHLRAEGNEITVASRNPPASDTPMSALNCLKCDYMNGAVDKSKLASFDALVFAAGQDPRHSPKGDGEAAYWQQANVEAVPRFFALARESGIRRAINIGSYYPQAAPWLIDANPYVRSRHLADIGVRALASRDFNVVSINPPSMIGAVPGLIAQKFKRYTEYAEGQTSHPVFAPAGGNNFMSLRSLSEAISGALRRGESGRSYLVGDENLSFQECFQAFFRAVGNERSVPVLDQEHPLLPDAAIIAGRGNTVYYEPHPDETALLGYRRGDVRCAIREVVEQYRSRN